MINNLKIGLPGDPIGLYDWILYIRLMSFVMCDSPDLLSSSVLSWIYHYCYPDLDTTQFSNI